MVHIGSRITFEQAAQIVNSDVLITQDTNLCETQCKHLWFRQSLTNQFYKVIIEWEDESEEHHYEDLDTAIEKYNETNILESKDGK